MYLTGFADEASFGLARQIAATLELGWSNIESRAIGGTFIHDMPQWQFDKCVEFLELNNIHVNCFGSAVGNWAHDVQDDFAITLGEVERCIPRMKRLGTKLIRIMSYKPYPDKPMTEQLVDERVRRLKEITKRFLDEGIQPVHENCSNYGGQGWCYTLELLEKVPGLKLVYDTGNPVFTRDRSKPEPCPMESSWEFYSHVKEHIVYVHIKDGVYDEKEQKCVFTWAGDGDGDVKKIVTDLLKNGYDGGISMEPHLANVFHDASITNPEEIKYKTYVEYGQRFMKLLEECKAAAGR